MGMVPKTALALLLRAGADPTAAIASLCLEATMSNIRGQSRLRDHAVEAASILAEEIGRSGTCEIRIQPLMLSRMKRIANLA